MTLCKHPGDYHYPAKTVPSRASSRSDHLLEPVFAVIDGLDGKRLTAECQAEVIAKLRVRLPRELQQSSGRALSSALWKLVVEEKRLVFAEEEVSLREHMPSSRIYRVA